MVVNPFTWECFDGGVDEVNLPPTGLKDLFRLNASAKEVDEVSVYFDDIQPVVGQQMSGKLGGYRPRSCAHLEHTAGAGRGPRRLFAMARARKRLLGAMAPVWWKSLRSSRKKLPQACQYRSCHMVKSAPAVPGPKCAKGGVAATHRSE